MTDQEVRKELATLRGMLQRTPSERIWDVATKFAVPATMALIAWQFRQDDQLSDHSGRLSVIESRELPPPWLIEITRELKDGQKEIRDRLTHLEAKVEAGEGR